MFNSFSPGHVTSHYTLLEIIGLSTLTGLEKRLEMALGKAVWTLCGSVEQQANPQPMSGFVGEEGPQQHLSHKSPPTVSPESQMPRHCTCSLSHRDRLVCVLCVGVALCPQTDSHQAVIRQIKKDSQCVIWLGPESCPGKQIWFGLLIYCFV